MNVQKYTKMEEIAVEGLLAVASALYTQINLYADQEAKLRDTLETLRLVKVNVQGQLLTLSVTVCPVCLSVCPFLYNATYRSFSCRSTTSTRQ